MSTILDIIRTSQLNGFIIFLIMFGISFLAVLIFALTFRLVLSLELLGKRGFKFLKRSLLKLRLHINIWLLRLFGPHSGSVTKLTKLIDAYADEPIITFDTLDLPSPLKRYNTNWVVRLLNSLPEKTKLKLLDGWHDPERPARFIKGMKSVDDRIKWVESILKNLKARGRGVQIVQEAFKSPQAMSEGEIIELLNKLSPESLKELIEKGDLSQITYLLLLAEANLKGDVSSEEGPPFIRKVLEEISWERARELRRDLSLGQQEILMSKLRQLALLKRRQLPDVMEDFPSELEEDEEIL